MPKKLYEETDIQNIASAIREKSGTTETYRISEMADAIENISTGGGNEAHPNYVSFKEYSGTELDISWLRTDKMSTIESMFNGCSNVINLDVSKFDTSNFTNFNSIFYNCNKLKSLDLSNFNTPLLNTMQNTFYNCQTLTELDLSSFNISKATAFNSMCHNCTNLETINLSNWTNSKNVNLNNAFFSCSKLKNVDLKNIYTTNKISIGGCFYNCTSLEYIDIRNMNLTVINTTMYYRDAFGTMGSTNNGTGVPANCLIIVKDNACKTWITEKWQWLTNVKTVDEALAQGLIIE